MRWKWSETGHSTLCPIHLVRTLIELRSTGSVSSFGLKRDSNILAKGWPSVPGVQEIENGQDVGVFRRLSCPGHQAPP